MRNEIQRNDLKDILDIYFRTPLEDKNHSVLFKQFPKPDVPALTVPELVEWLVLVGEKESLGQQSECTGSRTYR